MLNNKLQRIFKLIDYKTPFTMKFSKHSIERLDQRITETGRAQQLGKLVGRITNEGLCELLYFQTRYASGENVGQIEFAIEDLVVPITFVGDYCVMRTIMIQSEGSNRDKFDQIDLGDEKFMSRSSIG